MLNTRCYTGSKVAFLTTIDYDNMQLEVKSFIDRAQQVNVHDFGVNSSFSIKIESLECFRLVSVRRF